MSSARANRIWPAAAAFAALALCASASHAQGKAPPEVCQAKLDRFLQGETQEVTADLEWFAAYCEPAIHERAVNAVGEATMEAALQDTKDATHEAAAAARDDMAAAHRAAAAASSDSLADAVANGPGLVVVAPGGTVRGPAYVHPVRPPAPRPAPPPPAVKPVTP
jgi:hypothetical protein